MFWLSLLPYIPSFGKTFLGFPGGKSLNEFIPLTDQSQLHMGKVMEIL